MSQSVGILSTITSNPTARKVAYIRSLSSDIEEQAIIWMGVVEATLNRIINWNNLISNFAAEELKRKDKKAKKEAGKIQQQAEQKRKEEVKMRRMAMTGRTPEEIKKAVEKAKKEANYLKKSKGRGFKAISPEEVRKQELLKQKEELAKKVRTLREQKKAEELAKKREEDRRKTEEHKTRLLKQQQERKMAEMWEARRQEKLVEALSNQQQNTLTEQEVNNLRKERPVSKNRQRYLNKVGRENEELERQLGNLQKELEALSQ